MSEKPPIRYDDEDEPEQPDINELGDDLFALARSIFIVIMFLIAFYFLGGLL